MRTGSERESGQGRGGKKAKRGEGEARTFFSMASIVISDGVQSAFCHTRLPVRHHAKHPSMGFPRSHLV